MMKINAIYSFLVKWALVLRMERPIVPNSLFGGERAWDRRSLLVKISQGEPSRRDTRSANHTGDGQNGATNIKQSREQRVMGGKAYRQILGQICTMVSSPSGAGGWRENHRRQWVDSSEANKSTSTRPNFCYMASNTWGWSPLASIPALIRCLLTNWGVPGCKLSLGRAVCLLPRAESAVHGARMQPTQVVYVGCLSARITAHYTPTGLGGSVLMLRTQPSFPWQIMHQNRWWPFQSPQPI